MTTYYKAVRPDGPQGAEVAAIIERARRLTGDEASRLIAAQRVEWYAAWRAARDAGWYAGWYAEWDAAWAAARDAAGALVVRDLLTAEDYDTLTRPWREAIGPIHPDDPDMRQS